METTIKQNHHADNQLQLIHEREELLSLMAADMKILKSYLNELKELGLELKKRYKSQYHYSDCMKETIKILVSNLKC